MVGEIIVKSEIDRTTGLFVGQEEIWHRLVAIFGNNRVAGAYLFHGPPGTGKEGFAIRFASLLNCLNPKDDSCGVCSSCLKFKKLQHPNLTLVVPLPKDRDVRKDDPPVKALSDRTLQYLQELITQKSKDVYFKINLPRANTILLNSIRHLREKVYLKAMETGRKMILVFDAHKLMTQQGESGNALLKILEEPPGNTTFILITEYSERLAGTILSRCQSVYFPPVPEEELVYFLKKNMAIEKTEALLLAHLSQGNVRMAKNLAVEKMEDLVVMVTSLVEWVTSSSESGWRNFLHHGITMYRGDPQEFFFHLQLLSYWFRDAMVVKKANGQAKLILGRVEKEIRDFSQRYPSADYPGIVSAIETCTDSFSRNYNITLVLMNLLLDIQENLQGGVES